jgi:long-subunit acyl-CoA synthetase (AMP-forming)
MTETSVVVTAPSEHDVVKKTSGSLIAGCRAKILDLNDVEIKDYDKSGELLIQSPAVALGYLNNEKATAETFVHHEDGRWIRTGDEALVTLAPSGYEHIVIVDRIKELIKVKVSNVYSHTPKWKVILIQTYRVIKSHQLNWKPTYLLILL